jgi:hypothetical protein
MNVSGDEYALLMNLYAAYNLSADTGDPTEYASCFSADGTLTIGGEIMGKGRDQLHVFIQARQAERGNTYRRHWNGGIHFEKIDDRTIRGRCYLNGFTGVTGAPTSVQVLTDSAVCDDVLVLEDGSWKFASRKVTLDSQTG